MIFMGVHAKYLISIYLVATMAIYWSYLNVVIISQHM